MGVLSNYDDSTHTILGHQNVMTTRKTMIFNDDSPRSMRTCPFSIPMKVFRKIFLIKFFENLIKNKNNFRSCG